MNDLTLAFDDLIPPEDGVIHVNSLGTVLMNFNTLKKIYKDEKAIKAIDNVEKFLRGEPCDAE